MATPDPKQRPDHGLEGAIRSLTELLYDMKEERKRDLVTKADLKASEARIIAAFGGGTSADLAQLTAKLKPSTDNLKAAVIQNQP